MAPAERCQAGTANERGSGGPIVEQRPPEASEATSSMRRFDLAPPRRFLFPAVLLLLAEEPGYGYRLVKELEGFRLGATDRPSVYRTLAQLERDGLVTSWSDEVTSAQSRRLYRLTPEGERRLRVWMGVIKEERDGLDAVLRRYAASRWRRCRAGRRRRRLGCRAGPLGVTRRGDDGAVDPTAGGRATRRRARPPGRPRRQPTAAASSSSPIARPCSSRRARRSVR